MRAEYVGWSDGTFYFRAKQHQALIPVPTGHAGTIHRYSEPGLNVTLEFRKFDLGSWWVVQEVN